MKAATATKRCARPEFLPWQQKRHQAYNTLVVYTALPYAGQNPCRV